MRPTGALKKSHAISSPRLVVAPAWVMCKGAPSTAMRQNDCRATIAIGAADRSWFATHHVAMPRTAPRTFAPA
jgi:hypothetical protein